MEIKVLSVHICHIFHNIKLTGITTMGNQCCVDSKKTDMMAEYDQQRGGSRRSKGIKKDKELVSGEGMGDDAGA